MTKHLYSSPIGNLMSTCRWNGSSLKYKDGSNGREKDGEGSCGDGATYDYGFRIYNSNLGEFLSIDPLFTFYPWYTPYQFAGNKPIWAIDLDGLEEYYASDGSYIGTYGTSSEIRIVKDSELQSARDAFGKYNNGDRTSETTGYLANYLSSDVMGSTSFADDAQDVNDVLNDAPLETWANNHQNCYTAACKQMSNAGQSMQNKYQAIQTDVDNTLQPATNQLTENTIGGVIYTMPQLKAGNPVMIGVKEERSSDGSVVNVGNYNRNTGHFVVISSMQVNNGAVTFGYYHNANSATGKSTDNRFDVDSSTGAMQDNTNVGVGGVQSYTVSEVRKIQNNV